MCLLLLIAEEVLIGVAAYACEVLLYQSKIAVAQQRWWQVTFRCRSL
jgi:hypothetical protein